MAMANISDSGELFTQNNMSTMFSYLGYDQTPTGHDVENIHKNYMSDFDRCKNLTDLELFRVKYVGRMSGLTMHQRLMFGVPKLEKEFDQEYKKIKSQLKQ
jgi:hypothetical protein